MIRGTRFTPGSTPRLAWSLPCCLLSACGLLSACCLLSACSGGVAADVGASVDAGRPESSAPDEATDDETSDGVSVPTPNPTPNGTDPDDTSAPANPPPTPDPSSPEDGDQQPAPGNVLRLTQAELNHALRDLLSDPSNAASTFLAEDEFSPFDNDAHRQIVSPTLIESVHALAEDVAGRVAHDATLRAEWMPCSPSDVADAECFDQAAAKLARLFFRREVADEELAGYRALLAFATEADDFYFAIELLLSALIQDPEFLYRLERPQAGQLSGAEVATRMAFTFWGTVPDDALLTAAADGALASGSGRAEVAREMLQSPLSREQVFRFHSMWLGYRAIPHDAELNAAFQLETEKLIERVVFDEPQSYLELFRSPQTYLTEGLASHYALPAPEGGEGWVTYPGDSGRAGILSHGSVLSAFSKFDDTSPTQRGIFVRTRLLCQTVPPPPPAVNVDEPPGGTEAEAECKLDRYRAHREQSGCMECHQLFDPIGEGLERFDRAGRYREHDDGKEDCPVDGRGELPDYGAFNGPAELATLLTNGSAIQTCLTQQLLSYARGTTTLSPADQAFATDMAQSLEQANLVLTEWLPQWAADDRFVDAAQETP